MNITFGNNDSPAPAPCARPLRPAPAPAPCARARPAPVLLCCCSCFCSYFCCRVCCSWFSVCHCLSFPPALVVPPSITYTDKFLTTDICGVGDGLVAALVVGSPNGSGFESCFRQVQFFSELVNIKQNRPL